MLKAVVTCVLACAFAGTTAFAQVDNTAQIQMRPDEAFWNAIRSGEDVAALELFLSAHPDSPYAAEARARLAALKEPAPPEPQPAPLPLPAAAPEAVAVEAAEQDPVTAPVASLPERTSNPLGVLTMDEILSSLEALDAAPDLEAGETPDPAKMADYLFSYRFYAGRDLDAPATETEIYEMSYYSGHMAQLAAYGYDASVIDSLRHLMSVAHQAEFGTPAPDYPSETVYALQRKWGLAETGWLEPEFLRALALLPEPLPFKQEDTMTLIGDWVFSQTPFRENMPQRCRIYPRPDLIRWEGAMLTGSFVPAPQIVYHKGTGSALSPIYAPGDLFDPARPVEMSADHMQIPLVLKSEIEGVDPDWHEVPSDKGDLVGLGIAMMENASGDVRIVGSSALEGPLAITFSSRGFTKAFRLMSETCSEGALDAWLL